MFWLAAGIAAALLWWLLRRPGKATSQGSRQTLNLLAVALAIAGGMMALRGGWALAAILLGAAAGTWLSTRGNLFTPRRRGALPPDPAAAQGMTREEALRILELGPDPSEADIREAHRRLIQKIHPDQGGSAWLAARVNEARDLLLHFLNN